MFVLTALLFVLAVVQSALPPITYYVTVPDPTARYEGATKLQHEDAMLLLTNQGYRIKSISVYGNANKPYKSVYAVNWVKRSGPEWTEEHHMSNGELNDAVAIHSAEGFVPVQITATGPRSKPVYAVVFEKLNITGWLIKTNMVDGDNSVKCSLQHFCTDGRNANLSLQSLAIYGTDLSDRSYAAILFPNPIGVSWQAVPIGNSAIEAKQYIDTYAGIDIYPLVIDSNNGNNYVGIFVDNSYGTVVSLTGLTSAGLSMAFNTYVVGQNLRVINVQGGGTGTNLSFSVIFAQYEQPKPRVWTEVHSTGANYTGNYTAINQLFKSFMQFRDIRSSVLVVRKNNVTRFLTAYTWAPVGYPITQPYTTSRIASISKTFASAAMYYLQLDGFNLSTLVFEYVGINTVALPTQEKDNRVDQITVQHCLEHTAGWNNGKTFDPTFNGRIIARELGLPGRPTRRDYIRYMYGEPLQNKPGNSTPWTVNPGFPPTTQYYNSFGYMLLEEVIEKRTNMTYYDYLNLKLLAPLGISDKVFKSQSLTSLPGEGSYVGLGLVPSDWDPYLDMPVPSFRGGWIQENNLAGFGLVAAPEAIPIVTSAKSVFRFGDRSPVASSRTGGFDGGYDGRARSLAPRPNPLNASLIDYIDYYHYFNKHELDYANNGMSLSEFNNLVEAAVLANF